MSVVLACNLGGTGFRAALVDRLGASLAESVVLGSTIKNDRQTLNPVEPARAPALVRACDNRKVA